MDQSDKHELHIFFRSIEFTRLDIDSTVVNELKGAKSWCDQFRSVIDTDMFMEIFQILSEEKGIGILAHVFRKTFAQETEKGQTETLD